MKYLINIFQGAAYACVMSGDRFNVEQYANKHGLSQDAYYELIYFCQDVALMRGSVEGCHESLERMGKKRDGGSYLGICLTRMYQRQM